MTTLDEATIASLVRDDLAHLIHPQYYAPEHESPVIFDHGAKLRIIESATDRR